jgi:hypothetical protein
VSADGEWAGDNALARWGANCQGCMSCHRS